MTGRGGALIQRRVSRWVLLGAIPFWAAALWLHTMSPLHAPPPPLHARQPAPPSAVHARGVPPVRCFVPAQPRPLGDYLVRSMFSPLGLAQGRYPHLLLLGS